MLLVVSAYALGSAGLRTASVLAPRGLERLVAAATIAAALAGLEAIGLGLLKAGGSAVGLALAAAATWLGARLTLPTPVSAADELAGWWKESSLAIRIAVAAVGGAGLAWAAWLVYVPALGFDSVQYHIPESVLWVQRGDPGSLFHGILSRVSYLPLMSEVLVEWQVALARSLVPVAIWAPVTMLLLVVAGWLGLRSLGVGRAAAAMALAAVCSAPIVTHYQLNGAYNDLPALAWLVTAGALSARARDNPRMLAPAILAASLAAGTKTPALPLSLLVVALAAWSCRERLREATLPLALAATAALVLGGLWYLRDLVHHGSPFWPDVAAPWGDPSPFAAPSFLDRPHATLHRFLHSYLKVFGGGIEILAAALMVPLLVRRRAVVWAAAATAVSVFLWLNAPATGAAVNGSVVGTLSTLRYILPAFSAGVVTLALATRAGGPGGTLAGLALGGGVVLGAIQTRALGYPHVPRTATPLTGAALGVVAALILSRIAPRLPIAPRPALRTATAAGVLLASAALALGASGFVERHARANQNTVYPYAAMVAWLAAQPRYHDHGDPVAVGPIPNGAVVGDRLQHRLELVPFSEPCSLTRGRLRRGWVLLNYLQIRSLTAERCLARVPPSIQGPGFRAYRSGTRMR